MEEIQSEIVVYSGVCRCCFLDSENDSKGLWYEYNNEGTREIYGNMIIDCFALPWQQPEDKECKVEEICSTCVDRLRDAYNFKQQMIMVEDQLRQFFINAKNDHKNKSTDDKVDIIDTTGTTDAVTDIQCIEKEEMEQTMECEDGSAQKCDLNKLTDENVDDFDTTSSTDAVIDLEEEETEQTMECEDRSDGDFDSIAFELENGEDSEGDDQLEDEEQMDTKITDMSDEDIDSEENKEENRDSESVEGIENEERKDTNILTGPRVRKRPKMTKRKKGDILRDYRVFSIENMEQALCAVREGKLSRGEAAFKYNVPVKTLAGIIRKEKRDAEELEKGKKLEKKRFQSYHEKTPELIEEIKKILMYTNATIYKSTKSYFCCAYCYSDGPKFMDPEDLRTHTRTQHVADKLNGIELLMRPYSSNEIVKLDILNLCCTICCAVINNWFEMFSHFEKIHEITFDQAYTRVIPYELNNTDLRCSICKDAFRFYHNLDIHMNCHYNNYLCEDCGDSFLSLIRLKKHVIIHSNTKSLCEFCGQIFSHDQNRKKHYAALHYNKDPTVKCKYCPETFFRNHQMQKHIAESHKDKVVYKTYDLCGKGFDMKINFAALNSQINNKPSKYKCSKCDLEFLDRCDLKKHTKSHISHCCDVCDKKYSSSAYLKHHKSKAHGDLEEHKKNHTTRCEICDRNYSSADYLKQHKWKTHVISWSPVLLVANDSDGDKENSRKGHISHYCDICNKSYSSVDNLKQHKWEAHVVSSISDVHGSNDSGASNVSIKVYLLN